MVEKQCRNKGQSVENEKVPFLQRKTKWGNPTQFGYVKVTAKKIQKWEIVASKEKKERE